MIADLRHRLVLEERMSVVDGGGGATDTWSEVATVWAALQQKSGREQEAADRSSARTSTEITIRYRADVTNDMRFRLGARHFNIHAVLDVDGRRRWLKCVCEEGGAS
ncbi:phage head closure protein [Parvibaculaceae bacterium PLY_AMNH_Bact1]|nr:phage head closure protein [Parvibaculaceae bacterium PLY_AMNH_Bact1]